MMIKNFKFFLFTGVFVVISVLTVNFFIGRLDSKGLKSLKQSIGSIGDIWSDKIALESRIENLERNFKNSKNKLENSLAELNKRLSIIEEGIKIETKSTPYHDIQTKSTPFYDIYDFNKILTEKINCVKSELIQVQPTVCLTDEAEINKTTQYKILPEKPAIEVMMKFLSKHNDWNLIDVGAGTGEFSLYAAKYSRSVITVEPSPYYQSRIHSAAKIDKLTSKITLLKNSILDKRSEFKITNKILLSPSKEYITEDIVSNSMSLNKLRDITPPDFKKAILRIDINSDEIKALLKSSELMEKIQIPVIIMSWYPKYDEKSVEEFNKHMNSNGYSSYSLLFKKIQIENWKRWPKTVLWIKGDLDKILN